MGTTTRLIFSSSLLALAFAGTVSSQAAIAFADFSSTSGLQLNGATHTALLGSQSVLRLTDNYGQGGSAFSTTAIPLTGATFSTFFSFEISNNNGIGDEDGIGADGLVFAVQNVASNVGGIGVGIGYGGISNSVGIEFDTYNNGGVDINGNHVGIDLNGSVASSVAVAEPIRFNNSTVWNVWIDYDGTNLEVRYSDGGSRPALPNLSESLDLASILGASQAYVGFTSGTGSAYSDHDILQWQFNSEFAPIETTTVEPVPEVQTYASAFGAALIAAQMLRRRLTKKA